LATKGASALVAMGFADRDFARIVASSGGNSNYPAFNALSSPSIIGQQKMGSL
jgi:hypothetical protein